MANAAQHLSAQELAEFNAGAQSDERRVRAHLNGCETCRRRRDEVTRFRKLLAQTGKGELRPVRDVVPSAMMRLRLRRHSVTNTNELLQGFVALVRGLAGLFSLPNTAELSSVRPRGAGTKDETHE